MDLRFECGWLAGERGWVDASVVVPSELGVQAPHGGPLVVEAAAGSLNVPDAKVISALLAAGRQCVVVSEGELSPEVSAWIPTGSVHIATGGRHFTGTSDTAPAAEADGEFYLEPGFAKDLFLGPKPQMWVEGVVDPNPHVAALLAGMTVRFAWDRPVIWLEQDGEGYTHSTDLQSATHGLLRGVRNSVTRDAAPSDFLDPYNELDDQLRVFGAGVGLGLRESDPGSPVVFLSVHVGSGQALLACTFSYGGRKVYFGPPEGLEAGGGMEGLNRLASNQPDLDTTFRGIPSELVASPRALQVVEQILETVATGIYCAVVAYGMRQVILQADVVEAELQKAWQGSIAALRGEGR